MMQTKWISTLLPSHLQLETYQGQITLELEQIMVKYPKSLPEWVWKNALKDALKNQNPHIAKPRNAKWTSFVKEHYDTVKSEMGYDVKRVDVLIRLGDMYQKSKSSSK